MAECKGSKTINQDFCSSRQTFTDTGGGHRQGAEPHPGDQEGQGGEGEGGHLPAPGGQDPGGGAVPQVVQVERGVRETKEQYGEYSHCFILSPTPDKTFGNMNEGNADFTRNMDYTIDMISG